MTPLENGVHALSREKYDRLDRVNWSTLKLLGKSPAHYRANQLERDDSDTDARKRGRATHLAVFEPERFRASYACWTGKVRRGKEWDAFAEENSDVEILTADMYQQCQEIGEAARKDAIAAKYLNGGRGELSVLWEYVVPDTNGFDGYRMDCKGRLDFVAQCGAIVDLKTTRDASPDGFGRECAKYEYHVQAAFYRDAYAAVTGQHLPYVLVAVEVNRPYVVQVYRVHDEILALGRERYRNLLARLNVCRKESRWPGYGEAELDLMLPRWAVPREDEDVSGLDLIIGDVSQGSAH